jgi:hypothetical protein
MIMSMNVLVVDDEQDIVELIAYNLVQEGFPEGSADSGIFLIFFDKVLLPRGRSIGRLLLLFKGDFAMRSRSWLCDWEREEQQRPLLLRDQITLWSNHPSRRHF